jgi:hypothetical protein
MGEDLQGKDPKLSAIHRCSTPDISGLPELPESWRWATADQCRLNTGDYISACKAQEHVDDGVPRVSFKRYPSLRLG